MDILEKINNSADVKKLSDEETRQLCASLRQEIINSVSKTGGHLASNLGAVELTVAIHRVYDSSRDRLVFDVGHQCYAHKMITGRREQFSGLRRMDGISGFPKPRESADDSCIAGHASTSVSNALGMARARSIMKEDYDVIAVIGDGALTGGLAYEGLSDCGESGEAIVVVLNDNDMSIGKNVGGTARLLARLRVRPGYIAFKRFYRATIGRLEGVYMALHKIKEWIKDILLPDNMFEDMGFYYLGPIDGHDVATLERSLRYAKDMRCPVLVHTLTTKGKGYGPAEKEPWKYHGVGPFDPEKGIEDTVSKNFSSVFGETLSKLADSDERIVAVTAAMEDGTGLGAFSRAHPDRFYDVGIAEGHAVSMAAGMAAQGLRPVFAVYSSFLQRAYDMMIHDVSLQGLPVVFAVDRAGIVGADGETHQGVFDVGYLRQIPGMRIYSPANYPEMVSMLGLALECGGPAALRYPRGKEGLFTEDCSAESLSALKDGADLCIVSYGILINEALRAAQILDEKGISAGVVKLNRLDNVDAKQLDELIGGCRALIVAEESAKAGCMGEHILSILVGIGARDRSSRLLNLGEGIVEQGGIDQLWRKYGIDAEAIVAAAEDMNEKSKA